MPTVLDDIREAYADCWLPWEEGQHRRNLDFRASEALTPAQAREVLAQAIPHGYNEFTFDLLQHFPPDSRIVVAREGSVCLYVKGKDLPSQQLLSADEYHEHDGETRIWWD